MDLVKYYLIEPNESLLKRASESPQEWAELLTYPALWKKREGHRTMWTEDDRVVLLKLMFLVSVFQYSYLPEFKEIVGSLNFDTGLFDRHWAIRAIDDVEDVEWAAKIYAEKLRDLQIETGRPLVDEWLRQFATS